jgi:hypothetical protein
MKPSRKLKLSSTTVVSPQRTSTTLSRLLSTKLTESTKAKSQPNYLGSLSLTEITTMPEVITYTDAPAEGYDWYYTTDLGVVGTDERGLPIRKVSSPECWHDAQRHRYTSGLHFAVGEAEWAKLSTEANPDYSSLRVQT